MAARLASAPFEKLNRTLVLQRRPSCRERPEISALSGARILLA
jgi:hypothetical protein